jgi:hypothetical protein
MDAVTALIARVTRRRPVRAALSGTLGTVLAALLVAPLNGAPAVLQSAAQRAAAGRLAAAKSVTCVFSTMSVGDWKGGAATQEIRGAKVSIGFDAIDPDEGSARVLGAFGASDIVVRLNGGTLHLVQSFREGALYATTIFPYESRPGQFRAVHTRHEFTEVSLPGFTSRPEQYIGECEITK